MICFCVLLLALFQVADLLSATNDLTTPLYLREVYTHEILDVEYKIGNYSASIASPYNDATAFVHLGYKKLTAGVENGSIVLVLRGRDFIMGDAANYALNYSPSSLQTATIRPMRGDIVILLVPMVPMTQCTVAKFKIELRVSGSTSLADKLRDAFYYSCYFNVAGSAFRVQ
ncbi:hypothetical protein PSACC_00083 [Paramicrosporidium saccamoebae]|uniref:Uncharacterized protein n=1 Tax=Paramicrosporidium saccamoebae TaxID=1246581 RepID=A0A2H9TQT4_9FUNG|nr:hypothetical protein PSACC_00083 [Paramicrosporidium saccamoebae]